MQPKFPVGLSRETTAGDVLFVGYFKAHGSPARDKEPFYALRSIQEPFKVSCIRRGDEFWIDAPQWPNFHGRTVRAETFAYDQRTIKQRLEPALLFPDTNEQVGLSELPRGLDFRLIVARKSVGFSMPTTVVERQEPQ